jgi:hypothetical protein
MSNQDRRSESRLEETAQRELCNLYSSPNIILQRQMKWDEHATHTRGVRNIYMYW